MERQSGYMISGDELFFFDEKPAAVPLYEAFAKRLMDEIDNVSVKVRNRIDDELMGWIKEAAATKRTLRSAMPLDKPALLSIRWATR